MNAGPNSTSKLVNSFALSRARFSCFKTPISFSHPTPVKNNAIGISVCHSLLINRVGYFV